MASITWEVMDSLPTGLYGEVMTAIAPPNVKVGPLVREWRMRRRRSQLDLALEVGVSARHLSFVETGRSKPSPELVLSLADHLDVPLRDRNVFMLAAGYAPRYQRTPLDDPSMAQVRAALQKLLDGHDPYPGVVIDRSWNVVLANPAAARLTAGLPAELTSPRLNVFRVCLHPDGLAAQTLNFKEWATYLLGQLRRLDSLSNDPEVSALVEEVNQYPTVLALDAAGDRIPEEPPLLVPWDVRLGDHELSLFTTLTTFGTPRDITLDELAVELFYPANDVTAQLLAGR
jgi:transcriptional regulator with XRE-family HTH domain